MLRREAERLGLDWARLRRDMDDPGGQGRGCRNIRLASALRIEGTPALIIGDTLIPGAIDLATLGRLVAEARQSGVAVADARISSARPAASSSPRSESPPPALPDLPG